MQEIIDKKRIAKNSLMLYIRMLFLMVVSLYSTRILLKALGIDDFGIYNVVGGVVVIFSFVSNTLSSATQRLQSVKKNLSHVCDNFYRNRAFVDIFFRNRRYLISK